MHLLNPPAAPLYRSEAFYEDLDDAGPTLPATPFRASTLAAPRAPRAGMLTRPAAWAAGAFAALGGGAERAGA